MLLGEADGGAGGLALGIVGDGFGRAGDFADEVFLLCGQAADPSYEAARGGEGFDGEALREIFGGE